MSLEQQQRLSCTYETPKRALRVDLPSCLSRFPPSASAPGLLNARPGRFGNRHSALTRLLLAFCIDRSLGLTVLRQSSRSPDPCQRPNSSTWPLAPGDLVLPRFGRFRGRASASVRPPIPRSSDRLLLDSRLLLPLPLARIRNARISSRPRRTSASTALPISACSHALRWGTALQSPFQPTGGHWRWAHCMRAARRRGVGGSQDSRGQMS
jgi:hypothetical protein